MGKPEKDASGDDVLSQPSKKMNFKEIRKDEKAWFSFVLKIKNAFGDQEEIPRVRLYQKVLIEYWGNEQTCYGVIRRLIKEGYLREGSPTASNRSTKIKLGEKMLKDKQNKGAGLSPAEKLEYYEGLFAEKDSLMHVIIKNINNRTVVDNSRDRIIEIDKEIKIAFLDLLKEKL